MLDLAGSKPSLITVWHIARHNGEENRSLRNFFKLLIEGNFSALRIVLAGRRPKCFKVGIRNVEHIKWESDVTLNS